MTENSLKRKVTVSEDAVWIFGKCCPAITAYHHQVSPKRVKLRSSRLPLQHTTVCLRLTYNLTYSPDFRTKYGCSQCQGFLFKTSGQVLVLVCYMRPFLHVILTLSSSLRVRHQPALFLFYRLIRQLAIKVNGYTAYKKNLKFAKLSTSAVQNKDN